MAGQLTGTATVTAVQDTTDENDETVIVDISNVSGGGGATESGTQSVTTTITDDDAAPTVSIANVSGAEGSNMTFTATLSAASAKTVTVNYATSDGTATTAGSDYTATSGTLTFSAGETTKTFTVPILSDVVSDGNETFTATLSGESNATLGTSTATGTITENPTVTIASDKATLKAGETAAITFTLSEASTDFIASDVSVTGGVLSSFNAVSSTSYTATFTPTAAQSLSSAISVLTNTFTNATNISNLASTTNVAITGDTLRPTITSIARQTPTDATTNADTLVYRVIFSEAVSNVDATDFSVTGTTATVSNVVSAGGNAYDVTISGGGFSGIKRDRCFGIGQYSKHC